MEQNTESWNRVHLGSHVMFLQSNPVRKGLQQMVQKQLNTQK